MVGVNEQEVCVCVCVCEKEGKKHMLAHGGRRAALGLHCKARGKHGSENGLPGALNQAGREGHLAVLLGRFLEGSEAIPPPPSPPPILSPTHPLLSTNFCAPSFPGLDCLLLFGRRDIRRDGGKLQMSRPGLKRQSLSMRTVPTLTGRLGRGRGRGKPYQNFVWAESQLSIVCLQLKF